MKKYLLILLSASTLFCMGCSGGKKEHQIVFATSAEYPPFEYHKDGELLGFDIDLAKKIGQELGKEVVFKDMQFSNIIGSLLIGEADAAISTLTITEERAKQVDFSDMYYKEGLVAVVKSDSGLTTKEQLNGKVVTAQLGSTMELWSKDNLSGCELRSVDNNNIAIESLKAGHAEAVIIDKMQGMMFSKKNKGLTYFPLGEAKEGYGIAFPKGSQLKYKVNEIIKKLKNNGELAKLEEKWIVTQE